MSAANSSSSDTSGLGSGFGAFPGIQNFVGPPLLGAFFQALETGVIINQAITFFGHTTINRARSSSPASYQNGHKKARANSSKNNEIDLQAREKMTDLEDIITNEEVTVYKCHDISMRYLKCTGR